MFLTNYKKINIILGWLTFAIALITYTLTLEPTVSYWDCGEYIATSVKLEVGHPPGAPLFQMLGAFFAMFTSDVTQIAKMVNFMSGLASAFTILFMFWTITNLAKKLALKSGAFSESKAIAILGSGLVGSLAYTFSDSFWFSAVEAEVYAMSSFLMALLFWLALKWENEMLTPRGHKWLLLISFIVGLSFGVHILSLLVIPAIVFIYIYKHYENLNTKQFIIANAVAILVLAFVFKFLFPFTLKFFSVSEIFFVNTVGLPFNSGSIIAGIILAAAFFYGLKYTRSKKKVIANTLILSVLFIMIGFSCWLMLPIRSNANTTINENNPASARELLAYYNREQYGDANVFYDTYYSITYNRQQKKDAAGNSIYKDEKPKYEQDEKTGKYVIVNNYKNATPVYTDEHKGFIPRMTNPAVINNYKSIVGIDPKSKERPSFAQNIEFMLSYQFGYMYGRYLMWNFVGRQNDEQGNLDLFNGNWLSGIDFIDEFRLGPQTDLPSDVKNNKGRNKYYFFPLIFGIIGLIFQLKKDQNNFYTLFLFFAFTGLAIIFYTNPKPFEPRERDYAVVGSFYIFAIWVGFGVYAIYDALKKYMSPRNVAMITSVVALFAVPVLMASENWDDHDRSGKYTAHFNAKTYLDSCDENAIMFTIGDNDTFPLWYMQEVENYRTDIKLINTSLFATDWYIDQMKRKTYNADPIPSQLTHEQYKHGSLDVAYHFPQTENRWNITDFMKWIASTDERTYIETENGHKEKFYPTNKIRLTVDKQKVLESGLVPAKDSTLIVPYIDIDVDQQGLTKNRILMLDILANNNWKHPIYFTGGANADEEYLWMKDYLQLDGLCYKFIPVKTKNQGSMFDMGKIYSDSMYEKVTSWDWSEINSKDIYLDVESRKNSISFRNNLMRLTEVLISEKQFEKAEEILDLSLAEMPIEDYGHYGICLGYTEYYYQINKPEKARAVSETLIAIFQEKLLYYSRFDDSWLNATFDEIERTLNMYRSVMRDIDANDQDPSYIAEAEDSFIKHVKLFQSLME
ncbi:glycosyltransferase family 117 protein [Flavicella marina]|uniref:glycosyltransferase family 117 protein n=1 Tax=Flavicella marina TaxID=1475951 RepID=UPI001264E3AD|nr:DUF2723 domain-containing protein [Flavicella marina]